MTKLILSSLFLFLGVSVLAQPDYAGYVNPFIGTGGHGHTYPGATVPFGMVQLSPDTRIDGSWDGCGGYHYSDSVIYGFSHTHLSGTGCSDYGDIMLMPMAGAPSFDPKVYASEFSHHDESAGAGYYSVLLNDNKVKVELTATARVGMHRYTFQDGGNVSVILDLTHRDKLLEGKIRQVNNTTFEGLRRSSAWAKDQWVFYRIEFSSAVEFHIDKKNDNDEKAWFKFNIKKDEKLIVKVALSSVSEEGAKKNMDAELPHWDFDRVKKEAHASWQKELKKIEVSGGTEEQMKIFYTALYHTMIQPNIYNDVDGQYRGRDLKIHKADGFNYYSVFSLWDTFRAWHPLMTIIDPDRVRDYIKTFLAQYDQGGLLPVWELSSNETECMIGYHSVSVIADAAVKGITGFDMEKAFTAMKKSAESRDRYGLGAYMDKGCLSVEDENESVSKTLEYSYDDWCIARMAQLLHHEKDDTYYMERSQYWKNLFDSGSGFIRPRKNGGWYEPFDAREVNNNYTEANAWQYTFFVPHEMGSMIQMSGGKEMFEKKLDELFSTESKTTGREQADITGLIGQYAHGNEPSHHMAYLYNHIGKPWKTREKIHKVLKEFYHDAPDGLIGNEDCGQMSAWYVMSAMGLYQVCPGDPAYDIVPPLFPDIKIHQDNKKTFSIKSKGAVCDNCFIDFLQYNNGIKYHETAISYKMIQSDGVLNYFIEPHRDQVTSGSYGGRLNLTPFAESPLILSEGPTFKSSAEIKIIPFYKDDKIYFKLSGNGNDTSFVLYNNPIPVCESATVTAFVESNEGVKSKTMTAHFYKMPHPEWKINLVSEYSKQYTAGGDEGLIDGIRGDENWRKGNWQGYQNDFECLVDFGREVRIKKVSSGFLQDVGAWIMMPKQVEFSFSMDGKSFSEPFTIKNEVDDHDTKSQTKDFSGTITPLAARYVKIKAVNYGKLPEWHIGAGGQAWIFADEIDIQ